MYEPLYFKNFNEYLKHLQNFKGELVSPGGAAQRCGVGRNTVHHWMHKSGVVRSFIYDGQEGKFILISVEDVDTYWLNSEEKAIRDSGLRRTSSSVSKKRYAKA